MKNFLATYKTQEQLWKIPRNLRPFVAAIPTQTTRTYGTNDEMSIRSTSSKSSALSRDGTVRSIRSTSTKASSITDPVSVSPAAKKRRANAVRGVWADQPLTLMDSPMRTDEVSDQCVSTKDRQP